MKSHVEKINLALNIFTATIAIVGIFIAFSANRKADEANRLSLEANQIAKESNQLTITSLNADVQIKDRKWSPTLYTCVNPLTGTYLSFMRMVLDILVTNSGGNTTSLVGVKGYFTDNINLQTVLYADSNLSEQVALPFDIPPGSSRKFWIASFELYASGKTLDTITNNGSVAHGSSFYWEIEFGNGQTMKTDTQITGFSPPWVSPEEDCVYTNKNFP